MRVGVQLVQHAAMLLVEDIEIGIPARDLPHIFDSFVQVDFVGQEHQHDRTRFVRAYWMQIPLRGTVRRYTFLCSHGTKVYSSYALLPITIQLCRFAMTFFSLKQ
ncbi:hypothetical protein [Caballeronia sp. S22]|uniref:hypothetical protein n=1 Tax=Caballeronia sp. S22 TaxID=3137182 RepID=UPI0035311246